MAGVPQDRRLGRDILVSDTRKLIPVMVRLTPALHRELEEEAARDSRKVAEVVRLAVREYLQTRTLIRPTPRPSVQAQHDRIRELCDDVYPNKTAFDVCAEIVPESADRLMHFGEARTVIDTLEARKANRNGNS